MSKTYFWGMSCIQTTLSKSLNPLIVKYENSGLDARDGYGHTVHAKIL